MIVVFVVLLKFSSKLQLIFKKPLHYSKNAYFCSTSYEAIHNKGLFRCENIQDGAISVASSFFVPILMLFIPFIINRHKNTH